MEISNKIYEVLGYTDGHTAMHKLDIKRVTCSDCGLHVLVQLPNTRQPDIELVEVLEEIAAYTKDTLNLRVEFIYRIAEEALAK